jgi:hypothetical protein
MAATQAIFSAASTALDPTVPAIEVAGSQVERMTEDSPSDRSVSEQASPPDPTAAVEAPVENARVSRARRVLSALTSQRPRRARIGIVAAVCVAVTAAALAFARPTGQASNTRAQASAKATHAVTGISKARAVKATALKKSAVRVKPAVHRSSGPERRAAASAKASPVITKAKHTAPRPALANAKLAKAKSSRTAVRTPATPRPAQAGKVKGSAKPSVSKTSTSPAKTPT